MPKSRSKRLFNRQRGNKPQKQKIDDRNTERGYPITVKENKAFEDYYKMQEIVPEGQWDEFMNTLRRKLPTTIRITSHAGQAQDMLRMIKDDYFTNLIIPREFPDNNDTRRTDDSAPTNNGSSNNGTSNNGASNNGANGCAETLPSDVLASDKPTETPGEVSSDRQPSSPSSTADLRPHHHNGDDPHKPICYDPEPPAPLAWYPDGMAWQLDFDRRALKHSVSLKTLHQFLISETESGNISRQEAVSMIPPLVMDVQSHHKVLDMCASPGSKTGQLIEMLHNNCPNTIPEGVVVANDFDNKRCYLMVHQIKRLETSNYLIINHDASALPSIRLNKPDEPRKMMKFDRILADVPCSGDGTMRKNPDIWKRWNPNGGICQHVTQKSILNRGLELLEVGGRLVYSTCSFNPIENEAVISHMLARCQGAVELVDISANLPGLIYKKGLTKWKVMTKSGEWFDRYEDITNNDLKSHIRPSMFCPEKEVAEKQNLEKCIRLLPHFQNTGGFFVAALCKTTELPWITKGPSGAFVEGKSNIARQEDAEEKRCAEAKMAASAEAAQSNAALDVAEGDEAGATNDVGGAGGDGDEAPGGGGGAGAGAVSAGAGGDGKSLVPEDYDRKRKRGGVKERQRQNKKTKIRGYMEDPFVFLDRSDDMFDPIMKFYGMSDDSFDPTRLMIRCSTGKRRHLYLTSDLVKQIVQNNEDRLKFINMGLKVLSRSESKYCDCNFRLAQDGIHTVAPFMSSRRITISKVDIVTILTEDNPFLSRITPETRQQLEKLDQGSVIFLYTPQPGELPSCKMVIGGWLGQTSTRSFLDKNERAHYLRLCGVETGNKATLKKESMNFLNQRTDINSDDENSKKEIIEDIQME